MPRIEFQRPPGFVTIGEGLSLAGRYWAASWERWVLAIVAVGLASGLARWLLGPVVLEQATLVRLSLPGGTGIDAGALPRLLAGPIAVSVVSLVADWFLWGNAVAGLRGRDVSTGKVVAAGLRTLLVLLGVALLFSSLTLVLLGLGALGLLGMLAILPLLVYAGLRLSFWTVGVFDGSGIGEAFRTSWALTRGAVLRVLGWSLALFGLGLLPGLLSAAVDLAAAPAPVVPAVVGGLVETAFQAFTVIVIAILYESQRQRVLGLPPRGVQATPAPASPAPGDEHGPLQPPPPPG